MSTALRNPLEMPFETAAVGAEVTQLAGLDKFDEADTSLLEDNWEATETGAAVLLPESEANPDAVGGCVVTAGGTVELLLSFTVASAAAVDDDDDVPMEIPPVSSASARRARSSASRRAVYSDNPTRFGFIVPSEIRKQSANIIAKTLLLRSNYFSPVNLESRCNVTCMLKLLNSNFLETNHWFLVTNH